MKNLKIALLSLLLVHFTTSCGAKQEGVSSAQINNMEVVAGDDATAKVDVMPQKAAQQAQQKLIKTGNLTFKTGSVDKTIDFVKSSLGQFGAFSTDENSSTNSGKDFTYQITIRVPAENFDKLFDYTLQNADIKSLDYRSVSATDVSAQFIDVSARLKVKKESEKRLVELMGKAGKLSDLLEIERELSNVRSEIESAEGQLKHLENQVSLSTLNVTFYETGNAAKTSRWSGFWDRFGDSLSGGWDGFLTFIVILGYLWIPLVIAVGLWWLLKRYRKNRQQ